MSCPLNRNRWVGSGYVKPTVASSELDSKIKQMIAERERQDATLYPKTINETNARTENNLNTLQLNRHNGGT